MADARPTEGHDQAAWLREDLQKEYYAILDVVTGFDQRLMTVKGWSVTLSLAALGLGFQYGHYALFGLASITALGFWFIDATTKQHQLRYYPRMRDIELAAYNLNRLELNDVDPRHTEFPVPLGLVSSPRIDMSWAYPKAGERDWRTDPPWRRTPEEIHKLLLRPYRMTHVLLPHAVAFVLGLALLIAAVADAPGLSALQP